MFVWLCVGVVYCAGMVMSVAGWIAALLGVAVMLTYSVKNGIVLKNKLSHRAEMQRTQINHYCNNSVTRLDIDLLAPPVIESFPKKVGGIRNSHQLLLISLYPLNQTS